MSKYRGYCFTWNNPEPQVQVQLREKNCRYIVFGHETAPTTGTCHLQGYVYFWNPRSPRSVAEEFKGAHIEVARGSPERNREYCTKSGKFEEYGTLPMSNAEKGAQEKSRWEDIWEKARQGLYMDIPPAIRVTHYPKLKQITLDYQQQQPPPDLDHVTGIFYYGPSGVGKSRAARQRYPGAYIKNLNKWFDGYLDQQYVIMDDLDPEAADRLTSHLKIWCDHYAFTAETKGGSRFIRPKWFVITSQYRLEDLFTKSQAYEAMKRRMYEVQRFTHPPVVYNPDVLCPRLEL